MCESRAVPHPSCCPAHLHSRSTGSCWAGVLRGKDDCVSASEGCSAARERCREKHLYNSPRSGCSAFLGPLVTPIFSMPSSLLLKEEFLLPSPSSSCLISTRTYSSPGKTSPCCPICPSSQCLRGGARRKVHSLGISMLPTQSHCFECAGSAWPGWANFGLGKTKARSLAGREDCTETELGINLDTSVFKAVCVLCLHPRH